MTTKPYSSSRIVDKEIIPQNDPNIKVDLENNIGGQVCSVTARKRYGYEDKVIVRVVSASDFTE